MRLLFVAVLAVAAGCEGADDDGDDGRPAPAARSDREEANETTPPASTASEAPEPAAAQAAIDPFALAVTDPSPPPVLTATQRHQAKGVNPQNPSRQSCVGSECHGGRSKPFLFAVSVCANETCRTPAADVEVRVATGDGKVYQAFTGADGNAWFAGSGALADPARVAIRKGTTTKTMPQPLVAAAGGGSCNMQSCHGADARDALTKNVVLTIP
jgi:hypothetical protein